MLIFDYWRGLTSSRALGRRCHDNVWCGFLTAQQARDFVAISRIGTWHAKAFAELFTQSLALCTQAGLVSPGRVALDRTKVRGAASWHRAMSHVQIVRAEGELATAAEALLVDAGRRDAAHGAAYGPDRRGDDLPVRLARHEGRLAPIHTAKAALEAEYTATARSLAEQAASERGEDSAQVTEAGDIAETTVVVLTSVLRQSSADCPALPEILTELTLWLRTAGISELPRALLAVAGYISADNATAVTQTGIGPLIATGQLKQVEPAPTHQPPRKPLQPKSVAPNRFGHGS